MTANSDYRGSSIKVLKGLEPVRKRPGMYVGGTDTRGLHHCLWELVDNAVDEALAGHCSEIDVTLHADGSASVADNGRGIPVDEHPGEGMPTATVVLTVLHAGGKFDNDAYKVSGGLHGVGASVTNALSERLELSIARDGYLWRQAFHHGGAPEGALERGRRSKDHGTRIRFWPDMGIFDEDAAFDPETVSERLQRTAYLAPGLKLSLTLEGEADTEGEPERREYLAERFSEILGSLDRRAREAVSSVIEGESSETVEGEGEIEVSLALRWHEGEGQIVGFANIVPTAEGQHITGLRSAVTRALNQYAQENNLLKNGQSLSSDDTLSGLVAAVAVRLPDPKFSGQTKDKLANPGVQGVVSRALRAAIERYFEENPQEGRAIIEHAKIAQKAREAADKARETVVERKTAISRTALPGKLADCQEQDPERSEVFIVEGDSAGGSAKQGRERQFQAILPLKGKILNTYRADPKRIYQSEEVKNIVLALGCGTKTNFDISKLRYHKIIILADADSDGAHIAALVLTLFHKYLPELVEAGHIYVALPPLYRARKGKQAHYLKDESELKAFFEGREDADKWAVQRFKGLGEMNPDQLWEAAMDPKTRRLAQIVYGEGGRDSDEPVFEVLMGSEVPPRRAFIQSRAREANIDL